MNRISKVLAVAAGFLLGSATAVAAGVVMSETAIQTGPVIQEMQHRTIYIQGNKQKVDTDDAQTITDLDKHRLYVVDKAHKKYVELPLSAVDQSAPGLGSDEGPGSDTSDTIVLERTGGTHVVADHHCDEYRGHKEDQLLQVTVSACVSRSAPGAQEIARFDRQIVAQMGGLKPGPSEKNPAGVVLEKKSVMNLRVPDPAARRFRVASLTSKTTVNSIKVKPLAENTFTPPKGFSKLEKKSPEQAVPRNLPDNLESAMLRQPLSAVVGAS